MLKQFLKARFASRRSEHGAVAILVAIFLTTLLIATAMVLDFGQARLDRQVNKSAADAAALAGVQAMSQEAGSLKPWVGVCAALTYLQTNEPRLGPTHITSSWSDGAGAPVAVADPCANAALLDADCVPNVATSWATYVGTVGPSANPRVTVELKAGYNVSDSSFPEESYPNLTSDVGDTSLGHCDNLAVIVTERRAPGFGSLATSSDLVTRIRSVGRFLPDDDETAPVGLLILEQHDCIAISTDGNTTKLLVKGQGTLPGLIHSDSLGDTPGNTGGCQSSKIVGGTGQVKAGMAPTGGAPGVIGIRALRPGDGGIAANAYDPAPAVVAEGQPGEKPEGRPLVTRAPVDKRYLAAVTTKVQSVWPKFAWDQATAASNGYTWVTPSSCNGTGITGSFTDPMVYINCPSGAVFGTATFPNATSVIVNGSVTVKSGETLALPKANELYIKGPGTSDSNDKGLDIAGRLRLHDTTDAACAVNDSATSGRSELVLGSGFVNATNTSALLRLCHTTMITMGNTTSMPVYQDPAPAPSDNGRNGYLNITGGAQDWTAPNLKPGTPATASDWASFEDLAFWTETSKPSSIGGNGNMNLSGIFMLPNANPFSIGGSGSQTVTNCQYVARKLNAHGGGSLVMSPDPNDAVQVNYYGSYALVR